MTKLTYLEKRFIPNGFNELRAEDINVSVYIGETNGSPVAIAYSGKRSKHDFYERYKTAERRDERIEEYVNRIRRNKLADAKYKEEKKAKAKEFKATIKVGTKLHTVFSYNMTFNSYWEVLEIKGAKVTLVELDYDWTSGDAGYTGGVTCNNERGTKIVEARFSVNGLKVDGQYASTFKEGTEHYENRMD